MKKLCSIMAAIICAAMFVCACAAPDEAENADKTESVTKDTGNEKANKTEEKEYQKKLDMISPSAYDNVMGLNLEKGTTLSVIGKAEGVSYWNEVKKGAEQAVEDINDNLGYEGKDKVKVTYSAPGTPDDVDEQVNILDEELARYPAAVAIAIADAKACEVQFDLAAESDIPVVAFDSGSDYQGLMATVSTDNSEAAREAAGRMAGLVKDTGKVILFVHDSKSKSAIERENAFREEIESSYPNITVAEIYHLDQLSDMQEKIAAEINAGTYDKEAGEGNALAAEPDADEGNALAAEPGAGENSAEEDAGQGAVQTDGGVTSDMITEEDVIDYIFDRHPDVKGVYATNGDAVRFALDVMEQKEIEVPVIGYDGDGDELEAIKDGRVDALLIQNPFGMGYAAVVASARAALSMGNEAVVDTGYIWLTRDNIEDDNIQKMLYVENKSLLRFRWI